jgi:hypothetical protein
LGLEEKLMSPFAIRLSVITICATALLVVPSVAPAEAGQKHTHIKKHKPHWRHHYGAAWTIGPARPTMGSYAPSEPVCPGIGRSFDCKIWPPPYADDPDRKTSRF